MTKRVFISSTCYDLIDLRSEIAGLVDSMGLTPLLSDDPRTGFEEIPSVDSIEVCLHNVRSSDLFVCVLSQRYGPSLGHEYDNVSATHLEFRTAKDFGLPIYFFVRDRLAYEFVSYRKAKSAGTLDQLKLGWIQNPKDYGVFELLLEQSTLRKGEPNWYTPFSTSRELKRILEHKLKSHSNKETVVGLIGQMMMPWFAVDRFSSMNDKHHFKVTVRNVGKAVALDVSIRAELFELGKLDPLDAGTVRRIEPGQIIDAGVVGPGDRFERTGVITGSLNPDPKKNQEYPFRLWIEYTIATGHRFEDLFEVTPAAPSRRTVHLAARKMLESDTFFIG